MTATDGAAAADLAGPPTRDRIETGSPAAVGLLDVADSVALRSDLEDLRARLLADPYFAGVPSMRPEARKTALYFQVSLVVDVDDTREAKYGAYYSSKKPLHAAALRRS